MSHRTPRRAFSALTLPILAAPLALLFSPLLSPPLDAQFGRNKVQYETFDFRVLTTPHFDVHFYPAESLAAVDAGRMAERWYARLSTLLGHEFIRRPLVFYANHPDFQQTNILGGLIDQGTGGVTESARNRVIIPFTGVYADNDHVIGHELVHVFQYDISDTVVMGSTTMGAAGGIEQLPLWLVEGMAEYLSLGRSDVHTAMWLRDAVLRNDLPTIKQLTTDPRYFPYRYGEALWAYIGGKWGDTMVGTLFRNSMRGGFELGIKNMLGMTSDSLSKEWHAAIRTAYAPLMDGMTRPEDAGARLLPGERATPGKLEISPALSPDGRYVAFLSSRNLVSIDLFVADVQTGHIVKKLTSPNHDQHFASLSFISAAGSWSPDGRQLAFVTVADGDNEIAIFDVERQEVIRHIKIPGVGAINDAAWGPHGEIAFSGTHGGISDLYVLDVSTGVARQLTNDRYAELQPAWSPDGHTLAFATDRGDATSFDRLTTGPMRLATIDVASSEIRLLQAFARGKQINPQFTPDGTSLLFIADHDGFSNIYRLSLADGTLRQVTRFATGVSGITSLSPALTVASTTGRIIFSVFDHGGNSLYRLEADSTQGTLVATGVVADAAIATPDAGLLPPFTSPRKALVAAYLADAETGLLPDDALSVHPLKSRLGIEYLGAPTVGYTFGGLSPGLGGSIEGYFSDMLNNHVVGATIFSGGGWRDLGAETFYLNQKRRLNWAVGASHVPYIIGAGTGIRDTTITINGQRRAALVYDDAIARVYADQGSITARYPLSTTRRFEVGLSANRQSYGVQGTQSIVIGNQIVGQNPSSADAPAAVRYGQASLAYVGDYSSFGFTSPIAGGRYRFEVSPMFGDLALTSLLADYRRYFFFRPVTLAFRGLHYGRYGADAENNNYMQPLFVGYGSLVRGYTPGSFTQADCTPVAGNTGACPEFDRLVGSRIAVANAELRIPLFGPRALALIPFFIPTEISPFVDAGVAWTRDQQPTFEFSTSSIARVPVVSAGVSARMNLFNILIAEFYYALPFQRPGTGGTFGFQLQPGW